jgi:hypothetical protein
VAFFVKTIRPNLHHYQGLYLPGGRPEYRVVIVFTVERSDVWCRLKIQMVWAQVPLVRVLSLAAVPAEQDFATRFAVQQLKDARPALASQSWDVVESTRGTRNQSGWSLRAHGIGTNPKTLEVPEHDVHAHRKRCSPRATTRVRERGQKPFRAISGVLQRDVRSTDANSQGARGTML